MGHEFGVPAGDEVVVIVLIYHQRSIQRGYIAIRMGVRRRNAEALIGRAGRRARDADHDVSLRVGGGGRLGKIRSAQR